MTEATTPSANDLFLSNFKSIVEYLKKNTDLFGIDNHTPVPASNYIKDTVTQNAIKLPLTYQKQYSQPLIANWDNFVQKIGNDASTLETICGPIYQQDPKMNATRLSALHRFQIVVSTIYAAFLDDDKRAHLKLNLLETTPPLAMFQKSGDSGPFTITVENIAQLFDGKVSVVSIPGTYAAHPLIWSALGHEVNGHDVLHSEPGLIDELGDLVNTQIGGVLGSLWKYWIDEAASDVYGTLFYGPHFTLNLAFFFSALNTQMGEKAWMRTNSSAAGGQLDVHPTDILRLGLGIGVIRALNNFTKEHQDNYIALIDQIRSFILKNEEDGGGQPITKVQIETIGEFDMAEMQSIAEKVGELIASSALKSFNGLSIRDLCTWNEEQESLSVDLSIRLLENNSTTGSSSTVNLHAFHSSAHILSAATIAVLKSPEKYDAITKHIENLLDEWYRNDVTWNPALISKHLMYRRKAVVSATPAVPAKGLFSFWS